MRFPPPFVLAALCLALFGCSKDPNAPTALTPISGRWISTDTVEVFTGLNMEIVQADNGLITGGWVGKTRVTNGKCDPVFGCAPANIVSGSNLSLRIDLEILGVGSYTSQLATKETMSGQIVRFGVTYPLTFRRVN